MTKQELSRRKFLGTSGLMAAGWALNLPIACVQGKNRRPNILFIMADDHSSSAISAYSSGLAEFAPSENIDRIAAEGAILNNCFCTNSICVPSRVSILTGQYSHINGARTLNGKLDPEIDNVAKQLQRAGYETAIVGKWHLKETPAGFTYYNVLRGQGRYRDPILFESGRDWLKGGRVHRGHSTDVITDEALAWLKSGRDGDKPFCLMVHYKAVHEPFYSDDRFRSLYEGQELPEPDDLHWEKSPRGSVFDGWPLEILGKRYLANKDRYPPPELVSGDMPAADFRSKVYQKFIKDYLRGVAGLDHNVGRLIRYIDSNGLREKTALVYTSDQGYFLGEHNLFDKRFMLEESLRMPFVIRYPAEIKAGTRIDDIILNIDFAPLFLDYAGTEISEKVQGRSFRKNLIAGSETDWRDCMYYHYWTNSSLRPAHYGIRTLRYKLIYYYGIIEFGKEPEKCWELYDLLTDPHERTNVYNLVENGDLVRKLKKRLDQQRTLYQDSE